MSLIYHCLFENKNFREFLPALDKVENLTTMYRTFVKEFGDYDNEGDTRYVWIFDDSVVKLIINEKYVNNNKNEISVHKCLDSKYFAKILDYDKKNFFWLQMEKVNTSKDAVVSTLQSMFKDPGRNILEWFSDCLINTKFDELIKLSKTKDSKIWVKGFENSMKLCSVEVNDLHEENIGTRKDGSLVFFDYGHLTLVEQNTLASGNVVGYMAPLGAKGIGSNSSLEKGFWRNDSGKTIKTASPALHKKKKRKSLHEMIYKEMALSSAPEAMNFANSISDMDYETLVEFLNKNHPKIADGVFRSVYDIGNGMVIKILRDKDEINENRDEVLYKKCFSDRFFTKIYAYDKKNFWWIISEKVDHIDPDTLAEKIKEKIKGTNLIKSLNLSQEPKRFVIDFIDQLRYEINADYFQDYDNEWLGSLADELGNCRHPITDLHSKNWGVRDNGELVILDYTM